MSAPSVEDIRRRLEPTEKILWSGKPKTGLLLRPEDSYAIPGSLVFLAFATFWLVSVTSAPSGAKGPPIIFPIIGVGMIVVALYSVVGRFFWDAYQRGGTFYAVTNRRAIIYATVPWVRLRSFAIAPASEITTDERRDGSGRISFGAQQQVSWQNSFPGQRPQVFAFDGVEHVAAALEAIRTVQAERR